MNYILRIKHKSKYFGFEKIEYKEFNSYAECLGYVVDNNIRYDMYNLYEITRF